VSAQRLGQPQPLIAAIPQVRREWRAAVFASKEYHTRRRRPEWMALDIVAQVRKTPKLAQKLGQLQPFTAVFPPECMSQRASSGPA
jgi:hypothetical protein